MKKHIFLLCVLYVTLYTYSQEYYWYKGQKIFLQRGNQSYVIYKEKHANHSYLLPLTYYLLPIFLLIRVNAPLTVFTRSAYSVLAIVDND